MKKSVRIAMIICCLFYGKFKSQANNNLDKQDMFELISERQKRNIEYELIQYAEIRRENASMGDLLSRMWGHFGKPQAILFEGYEYNIKDKKTGLGFVVSYGASGPAYYAEKGNVEGLKPVVAAFEKFLASSKNVDCEIEVDTDFGLYLCGSKDGIPYDKEKYKNEVSDLFNSGSTGNQYFDDLIVHLKNSMENYLKEHKPSYTQMDIDECINYLTMYVITVLRTKTKDEGMYAIKTTVLVLNEVNKRSNNTLIETSEREQIVKIINLASSRMGYSSADVDITEEWREF